MKDERLNMFGVNSDLLTWFAWNFLDTANGTTSGSGRVRVAICARQREENPNGLAGPGERWALERGLKLRSRVDWILVAV